MNIHSTHKTRMSDSTLYDEVCIYCGANDGYTGSAKLSAPCTNAPQLYYIRNAGYCGNSLRWWRHDRCGYTSNLDEALKVPLEEAKSICSSRKEDTYHEVSKVDAKTERHVTSL